MNRQHKSGYEEMAEYCALPLKQQRFMFYYGAFLKECTTVDSKETDTHIYASVSQYKLKFGNKLFITRKNLEGYTYDKTTGKSKIWYGKQFYSLSVALQDRIFESLNICWAKEMDFNLRSLISNRTLDRIIKNKINSEADIVLDYLKTINLHKLSIDPVKLLSVCKHIEFAYSLRSVRHLLKYCTDPAKLVENASINGTFSSYVYTVANFAEMFDEKYEPCLSDKEYQNIIEKYRQRCQEYKTELMLDKYLLF
jgi:hypothetical protein